MEPSPLEAADKTTVAKTDITHHIKHRHHRHKKETKIKQAMAKVKVYKEEDLITENLKIV